MDFDILIRDLTNDSNYYFYWFNTTSESEKLKLWNKVWDHAAHNHSENDFIQGLYDFYQTRGYLSYKQWNYLIKTVYPSIALPNRLKDRLNAV
jgi:hypothetical protein